MTVYLVVLMAILNSIAQRGSKVVVSLYALELGAVAAFIGPSAAGFAIELAGYRAAFALLALAAVLPSIYVLLHRRFIAAQVRHEEEAPAGSAFDLLAI